MAACLRSWASSPGSIFRIIMTDMVCPSIDDFILVIDWNRGKKMPSKSHGYLDADLVRKKFLKNRRRRGRVLRVTDMRVSPMNRLLR
jgi:hypothetical protein